MPTSQRKRKKMKRRARRKAKQPTSSRTAQAPITKVMERNWNRTHVFTVLDPTYRTVESDGIAATFAQYLFRVTDVPYLAVMAQQFEYYRIENIRVKYQPFVTQVISFDGEPAGKSFTLPNVVNTFVPYSQTFSTFEQLAQRGDTRIATATTAWERTIRPIPLMRAFDSALADGFINLGPQWITYDRQDVPHFGFWVGIEPAGDGSAPTFGGRMTFYYTVSYKNPNQLI